MQMCEICTAPCFPGATAFNVPEPGTRQADLRFGLENGREFYAVLLNNHPPQRRREVNPRVAIHGLSPASTQIGTFVDAYARTRDYGQASVTAAFSGGLEGEIISMMNGLGLTEKLGLVFPRPSLKNDPNVWVTSVVACATLGAGGNSATWDPTQVSAARRCIADRLVPELLYPGWTRLAAVIVLGSHGWKALARTTVSNGRTALDSLRLAAKLVLKIPHPSGSNGEPVALSKVSADRFPSRETYVSAKLAEYRTRPAVERRQPESEYVSKRRTVWQNVAYLREQISSLSQSEQ